MTTSWPQSLADAADMRHVLAPDTIPGMYETVLLWTHAAATTWLAGLVWVVQVVVYPSFHAVGAGPAWAAVHAHHTRAMGALVSLPWAVQGMSLAGLLVLRPAGVPLPLLLATGVLAATTVLVTVLSSVPLHSRLATGYDAALVDRLIATNWLRTGAWTAGAVCSLVVAGLATRS